MSSSWTLLLRAGGLRPSKTLQGLPGVREVIWVGVFLSVAGVLACLLTAAPLALAHRFGDRASRWVPVQESWSLHNTLSQPDFVVPGVPIFAAVAKGTQFRQQFLDMNK